MNYTAGELAVIIGVSRTSILRRKGIRQFIIGERHTGRGRPQVLYSEAVLPFLVNGKHIPTKEYTRQRRADRGDTRTFDKHQEILVVERAKALYLLQANSKAVKPAVEYAVEQLIAENRIDIGKYESPQALAWYIYNARIMRNDKYYQGWLHRFQEGGTWRTQHEALWQKPKHNAKLPTMRYDLIEYMVKAGVAGEGIGGGWFRSFDATKFDAWVQFRGQKRTFWYYLMPCGLTGYPLLAAPIETEDTDSVIRLLAESVRRYGTPLVLQMDNARVNRSEAVQSFVRTLWGSAELQQFANGEFPWFTEVFARREPYIFNLPNIPRYVLKGKNEEDFKRISVEYIQRAHARTYTGGTREAGVHLTLSNRPAPTIEAPPGIAVWRDFEDWLYTAYIQRLRPKSLATFHRLTGLPPTIESAWEYFSKKQCWRSIPAEHEDTFLYWSVPAAQRHTCKASKGFVAIQHNKVHRNYVCEGLSQAYEGRQVCVVPIPNREELAYLFYVKGDNVSSIGIAHDSWVRTPGEVAEQRIHVQKVRAMLQKESKEASHAMEKATWVTAKEGGSSLLPTSAAPTHSEQMPSKVIKVVPDNTNVGERPRSPEIKRLLKSL